MITIKVEGISQKGKNRIKEHGDTWRIRETNKIAMLLEAPDGYLRWMDHKDDPDFKVVK